MFTSELKPKNFHEEAFTILEQVLAEKYGVEPNDVSFLFSADGEETLLALVEKLKEGRTKIAPAGETSSVMEFVQDKLVSPEEIMEEMTRKGFEPAGKKELKELKGKKHNFFIVALADQEKWDKKKTWGLTQQQRQEEKLMEETQQIPFHHDTDPRENDIFVWVLTPNGEMRQELLSSFRSSEYRFLVRKISDQPINEE